MDFAMVRKTFFLTVVAIFFKSFDFAQSSIINQDFQESFNSIDTLLATAPTERCELINKVLEQQKSAELLMQAAQLTIKAFQLMQPPEIPTTTMPPTEATFELKDAGGTCPKLEYPYFNEQCVNVSGIPNACKDIRQCDFVDTILALGGWPTVCGWIHEDGNKWPKVCCGLPLSIGEPLKQEFVQSMIKNPSSSSTLVGKKEDTNKKRIEEDLTDAMVTDAVTEENPVVQCVLPLVPQPDTSVTSEDGVRFGNTPHSRQEYSKDSEFLSSLMHDSIFTMEFRTTGSNGVMFYVATRSNRPDYMGLIMREGKLVFLFDAGQGSAVISSEKRYNDGKWHRVVFLRQAQKGELVINDLEEIKGRSPGSATRVDDLRSPLFIGGLSEEVVANARSKLQDVSASFPGCIRNVDAHGELLTEDIVSVNTTTCSNNVEDGTFFSVGGGYLALQERFRVGRQISISLDIKPRNLSGVVMAVHGKEDYLVLQLIEGRVEFTVDSGSGPITVTHSGRNNLCDGQFHTLKAEAKANDAINLIVDGVSSEKRLSNGPIDTFDPLYVGGLPESSWSKSGIRTNVPFVGCMRNVKLNDVTQSVDKARLVGAVTLSTCPTN